MIAPTRICNRRRSRPVYYIRRPQPSTWPPPSWPTPPRPPHLTTIADRSKRAVSAAPGSPTRPGLLASTIISHLFPCTLTLSAGSSMRAHCPIRHALAARHQTPRSHRHLKWPNDVLVDGSRKVCGILAQLAPASSPSRLRRSSRLRRGIAQAPGLSPSAGPRPCWPKEVYRQFDPTAVAHEVLAVILAGSVAQHALPRRPRRCRSAGLAAEAEAALPLIGARACQPTTRSGTPALEGVALGLTPTGAAGAR